MKLDGPGELAKECMSCIFSLHLQQGSLQWRRELAALIIQLAWRQYLRRKLLRQSLRRQRVLHDWTPSVLAARQRALVEKIYSKLNLDRQITCVLMKGCTLSLGSLILG